MGFFSGFVDIIEEIADEIEEVADQVADSLEDLADIVGELGEGVYDGLIEVGDILGEGIAYAGKTLVKGGKIVFAELYNKALQFVGWLVDGIVWAVDIISDVARLAGEVLKTAGQFAFDGITLNSDIFDNLVDNFSNIGSTVSHLYETTVKGIFTQVLNFYEMTIGYGFGLIADVLDFVPYIGDYLANGIRTVNDFLVGVIDVAEFIVALPRFIECWLHEFVSLDAAGESFLSKVLNPDDELVESGRIQYLPAVSEKTKYAIFSDLHMFIAGDTDFFTETRSNILYKSVLKFLATQNYFLIENGDVEDLWRRDSGNRSGSGSLGSGNERTNKALLRNIIETHKDFYEIKEADFASKGRYARTIGNHDLPMIERYMQRMLRKVHPNVSVAEFLLIEDKGTSAPTHLIAHGHQADKFNRPGCEWIGEITTRLSTNLDFPIIGEMLKEKAFSTESVSEILKAGRENVLDISEQLYIDNYDEHDVFDAYEQLAGRIPLPWLILGHTHNPKFVPGIEQRDTPCGQGASPSAWGPTAISGGYLNAGTAGMWKDMIWFATIEADRSGNPQPFLRAATFGPGAGEITIRTFSSVAPCTTENHESQWLLPNTLGQQSIPLFA